VSILQSDVPIYENRVNIPLLGNKSAMHISILPVPTGHKRSKSRRGRLGNMSTKGTACIFSYDIPFQVSRKSNILNIKCFEMQWGILNKLTPIFSLINRWNGELCVQKFVSPGNPHQCPLQRMVDALHSWRGGFLLLSPCLCYFTGPALLADYVLKTKRQIFGKMIGLQSSQAVSYGDIVSVSLHGVK
jgi:hypothetical protein